jgi:hypothetical protein
MKPMKLVNWLTIIGIVLLCSVAYGVSAETRIAVLDFELFDLTLEPGIPAEIERTVAIKPLLEAELKKAGYVVVPVNPQAQRHAENGVGYLFEHHDAAAALAKQAGADYILVGRLHKPSFLFVYLMGHLIRAADAHLIGDFISEVKGSDPKLTLKGVENLTVKIDAALDKRYTPPPPRRGQH